MNSALPSPSFLMACAAIITALGVPFNAFLSFLIAYRQGKLKKQINGRMDELVTLTHETGYLRGLKDAQETPPRREP